MEWPIHASAACGSFCTTLRYVAAATAIVAAVLLILTSLRLARGPVATLRYATASGTPGPPQRAGNDAAQAGDMYGDAPWALSALPECFRQISSARGSASFVRTKTPAGLRRVASGGSIVSADCAVTVRGNEVRVARGADRLRVPPRARLYEASGGRLVLERLAGRSEEVRVYLRAGAF